MRENDRRICGIKISYVLSNLGKSEPLQSDEHGAEDINITYKNAEMAGLEGGGDTDWKCGEDGFKY